MKSKQELKAEFKELKPTIGVFQVKNLQNGKVFIDGNTNLTAIWNRFKLQLNFGNHPVKDLQNDWAVLGESQFAFSVLSEIKHDDEAAIDYAKEVKTLAAMFIDELQPFGERGYNKPRL